MRILICTQAVDRNDPILGFFLRWIEEIAKKCDHVLVICLRKGAHDLPKNVEIISLGEHHKVLRAFELCSIAFGRRREYDSVFVHMNPEYLVAAGWLWRLMGKKSVLWYTHKSVNVVLRIATLFANKILTASKESFRLATSKVAILGHGIDTDFFTPGNETREEYVLSVGRLSPSKRHDLAIAGAAKAGLKIKIIGDGPERESLEKIAASLHAQVEFVGGLTQKEVRDQYRKAVYLIHTSETGGLDKVVLEALACDLAVISTSDVFHGYPVQSVKANADAIAQALRGTRENIDRVHIIHEQHSLEKLIPKIMQSLQV